MSINRMDRHVLLAFAAEGAAQITGRSVGGVGPRAIEE